MSRTFDYLVCFSVYSLIILIIGKSSFGESDSIGKFFIGERKCGFWRLFSTFVGTWVSAATILGYTGNVFENGTSVIAVTVIPWFIGAGLLYLISGRIYDCDMLTIPQFIGERYHSRFLRTCCALLLSGGYVFYLVIQIKGFGIAAATLLNIDYKVAIFFGLSVYSVFYLWRIQFGYQDGWRKPYHAHDQYSGCLFCRGRRNRGKRISDKRGGV